MDDQKETGLRSVDYLLLSIGFLLCAARQPIAVFILFAAYLIAYKRERGIRIFSAAVFLALLPLLCDYFYEIYRSWTYSVILAEIHMISLRITLAVRILDALYKSIAFFALAAGIYCFYKSIRLSHLGNNNH